jgi:hypothetical protein
MSSIKLNGKVAVLRNYSFQNILQTYQVTTANSKLTCSHDQFHRRQRVLAPLTSVSSCEIVNVCDYIIVVIIITILIDISYCTHCRLSYGKAVRTSIPGSSTFLSPKRPNRFPYKETN